MSRSSKNIAKNNNLITRPGRSVTERSTGVFNSGSAKSVVDSVLLYQLVFKSKKAVFTVILLCLCFSVQSIHFAEANEDAVVAVEQEVDPVEIPIKTEVREDISTGSTELTSPVVAPKSVPEIVLENELDPVSDSSAETEVEPLADDIAGVEIETVSEIATSTQIDLVELPTATSTIAVESGESYPTVVASTTSTTTVTTHEGEVDDMLINTAQTDSGGSGGSAQPEELAEEGTTTEEANQSESTEDLVETTEVDDSNAVTVSNDNLVFTVESDSHFSFNKNECTRIEDGTFYCQKQDETATLEDSLIAAPDSDGDLEIYLVRKGERYQITHNLVDDASPSYDEISNTIVWHRLLNDRYQIVSYDIETGEETQITQTNVNNMEPARHGQYIVWQRWVENNWEIILSDGTTETQLTDSARHDIAPHIRGPLVIWNSQSNDGSQELKTYDIQSRTQTTIADSEGVSVSNPRMVVMYEAMYENGDIVTKGFDLVSGKIVPLQALPKQLPEELPNSEPTPEIRALIQSKPEPKTMSITGPTPVGGSGASTTASSTPEATASTSSSTSEAAPLTATQRELDLRAMSTPELIEHLTDKELATLSIPDLVLVAPIDETVENEETAHIPDLVIAAVDADIELASSTQTSAQ